MTDQDVLQSVYKRWAEDDDFRAEMSSDPKATLSAIMGIEIPSDVKVILHSPSTIHEVHLVMPMIAAEPAVVDQDVVNDGRVVIACTSTVPGGTCWNTPNCPTNGTCGQPAC
jgi:hypothetical protein